MKIQTYNMKASNGKQIRKATMVVLADGRKFKFTERMSRRQVITQLENMLAMAINRQTAASNELRNLESQEALLTLALEAVVNDSNFAKVSA